MTCERPLHNGSIVESLILLIVDCFHKDQLLNFLLWAKYHDIEKEKEKTKLN